jgi:hypothetical protein
MIYDYKKRNNVKFCINVQIRVIEVGSERLPSNHQEIFKNIQIEHYENLVHSVKLKHWVNILNCLDGNCCRNCRESFYYYPT